MQLCVGDLEQAHADEPDAELVCLGDGVIEVVELADDDHVHGAGDRRVERGVAGGCAVFDERTPPVVDDDALDVLDLVDVDVDDVAGDRDAARVGAGGECEGNDAGHDASMHVAPRPTSTMKQVCGQAQKMGVREGAVAPSHRSGAARVERGGCDRQCPLGGHADHADAAACGPLVEGPRFTEARLELSDLFVAHRVDGRVHK